MLFLVLRIIIGPLGVLGGTLAQRRLGPAVGGLVVGLPLTSLPLLGLVALQHGGSFAGSMTDAILIGSISEGFVLWAYAKMTARYTPMGALLGALAVFAASVTIVGMFHVSALVAGLLSSAGLVLALRWWPESSTDVIAQNVRSRLVMRVIAATVFTIVLVSMAGKLGALLSGLVDALPMTTMLMAFMTHQEQGPDATSQFIRGVLRGSFSWVISTVVLAAVLTTGHVVLAFALSLLTALLIQAAVQVSVSVPSIKRALSFS